MRYVHSGPHDERPDTELPDERHGIRSLLYRSLCASGKRNSHALRFRDRRPQQVLKRDADHRGASDLGQLCPRPASHDASRCLGVVQSCLVQRQQ